MDRIKERLRVLIIGEGVREGLPERCCKRLQGIKNGSKAHDRLVDHLINNCSSWGSVEAVLKGWAIGRKSMHRRIGRDIIEELGMPIYGYYKKPFYLNHSKKESKQYFSFK